MILFLLTLIYQENFTLERGNYEPLERNPATVEWVSEENFLRITGDGEKSWVWTAGPDTTLSPSSVLSLKLRGKGNIKIRFLFREDEFPFLFVQREISLSPEWQMINVHLKSAKPFSGLEFPLSLTPGRKPGFFIFLGNSNSSSFKLELDEIKIEEEK